MFFFFVIFLIGLVLPLILMKIDASWIIWSPAIIFLFASIIMALKASVFLGEGIRDLADTLYFMMFGAAGVGAIVGAGIVHLLKSKD